MTAPFDLFGYRKRDGNAEARIQHAIVEYVRRVAPDVLIFAIANGGLRAKAEAARLKWTGVLAGIPDLAIVAPGGRVCFIEVKQPRGFLSDAQREIRDWLIALGSPPAICKSIDDAREALAAWGVETNEARHD
jgi:VRR-NUC domain